MAEKKARGGSAPSSPASGVTRPAGSNKTPLELRAELLGIDLPSFGLSSSNSGADLEKIFESL